jgi:hypothetical protein
MTLRRFARRTAVLGLTLPISALAAAELDDVLRAAKTLARRGMTSDARTRANCTLTR